MIRRANSTAPGRLAPTWTPPTRPKPGRLRSPNLSAARSSEKSEHERCSGNHPPDQNSRFPSGCKLFPLCSRAENTGGPDANLPVLPSRYSEALIWKHQLGLLNAGNLSGKISGFNGPENSTDPADWCSRYGSSETRQARPLTESWRGSWGRAGSDLASPYSANRSRA